MGNLPSIPNAQVHKNPYNSPHSDLKAKVKSIPTRINRSLNSVITKLRTGTRARPARRSIFRKYAQIHSRTGKITADEFIDQVLKLHNELREQHGAMKMIVNETLVDEAQAWADVLASKDEYMKCDQTNGAGECLAAFHGTTYPEDVVNMWYSEINRYNFDHPELRKRTEHFTQLIWKNSTEFGCGFATSASGVTYVVGRYLPRGNLDTVADFNENVLPIQPFQSENFEVSRRREITTRSAHLTS